MNTTVRDLISSSEMQARGMKLIAERTNSAAAVSMMDLSVEAEALGAPVKVSEDEVPAVTGHVIETEDEARDAKTGHERPDIHAETLQHNKGENRPARLPDDAHDEVRKQLAHLFHLSERLLHRLADKPDREHSDQQDHNRRNDVHHERYALLRQPCDHIRPHFLSRR
jgi:hypothetical protein